MKNVQKYSNEREWGGGGGGSRGDRGVDTEGYQSYTLSTPNYN